MKRVCIIEKPLAVYSLKWVEVESVTEYLTTQFKVFPDHARIYHKHLALDCDVTPNSLKTIKKLEQLDGDFYVVLRSAEPISIATWIFYAITAVTAAFSIYTFMTMPKPVVSAAQSANNDLASRQNQARLGGRIPEIFGTVRAYPDLIAASYTFYNDEDKEIEVALMVLGRGYYQIHDCREDTTDVHDIPGYKVSVYDPHTSILGKAIYQVGDKFDYYPPMTMKSKSINGQTLEMPNDQKFESTDIYFEYPNLIKSRSGLNFTEYFSSVDKIGIYGADYGVDDVMWSGEMTFTPNRHVNFETTQDITNPDDFKGIQLTGALVRVVQEIPPEEEGGEPTEYVSYRELSGQYRVHSISKESVNGRFRYTAILSNASEVNSNWNYIYDNVSANAGLLLNQNQNSINLNGSYEIKLALSNRIELDNPDQSNGSWLQLLRLPNKSTIDQAHSVRLDKLDEVWVGWHNLVMPETEEIVFNFFFQNGLFYQDSKGGVWPESMEVLIEYQYIDEENLPIGDVFQQTQFIQRKSKSPFGMTVKIPLVTPGSVRFRVARTSPTKNDKSQDLCKIKDVYAKSESKKVDYGDVTVVRLESSGTDGALSLKEKKLNLLSTRRLPIDGTGELVATRDAGQALIYLALDEKNGRRTIDEVDIQQIKSEINLVKSYFGSDKAVEFSYTIDDLNLSFQEIAGMIASAVFCEAYRYGSKLRLKFEKPQEVAALLFNHRNKDPNTVETWTYTGPEIEKGYDGIELEYTDPKDDVRIKYHIWFDRSRNQAFEGDGALNPMTIKTTGIRTHEQAKTRAWREWNKLQYRKATCEFDALDESNLLTRNDKIIVANRASMKTQDGEVETQLGLTLLLSQPVIANGSQKIYLQMPDSSVDMIPFNKTGNYDNQITLSRPPRMPIVTSTDRYVKTVYQIVSDEMDRSNTPMMMIEMSGASRMTNKLTCVNYTDQYYKDDHRFF